VLGYVVTAAFVWALVAFAVAIDASRRGHHGGFWAILTFVTGGFGAILYAGVVLITNDGADGGTVETAGTDPERVRVCSACSSEHGDSQNHCSECGATLGPEDEHPVGRRLKAGSKRYCSHCKSEVSRRADTCPGCGAVF